MKKQLERGQWLPRVICTILVSCSLSMSASAQTFNPPGSFEDTWPVVGGGIGLTGHTSAYSLGWQNTALGSSDFVMSGWDDASAIQPAGVSWRLLQPGNPSVIMNQGVIPYTNVRDVEVGCVNVAGSPQLLVAYYLNGAGHRLDVYDMATGAPVWQYTNVLSTMPYYTRISIDCHKQYGVVIAWEDMNSINFVAGLNNSPILFSPILSLAGTNGETTVDVAFSHTGALLMQFVYYNPSTGNITESSFDYFTALAIPTPQFVGPKIHDINMVGTCRPCGEKAPKDIPVLLNCPYMNIDCPGHYNFDNWAYTYTTDNNNISVRLLDLATSPFASTVVVNNGSSLPSMPINGNSNVHPFLHYEAMCGGVGAINVAWYTNTIDPGPGSPAGYVGLRMDATGTALFSPLDYLTVANNPTWGSMTPVISLSKDDDSNPSFMYTIFPEFDPGAAGFRMENKYPAFCSNQYKGVQNGDQHNQAVPCNGEQEAAAFNKLHGIPDVSAYPNPFNASFKIAVPNSYAKEKATIILTDALGNAIAEFSGPANEANAYFETKTKSLAAGSYFLNVNVEGKVKETLKLTKVQ